jgi:hypothetical protein
MTDGKVPLTARGICVVLWPQSPRRTTVGAGERWTVDRCIMAPSGLMRHSATRFENAREKSGIIRPVAIGFGAQIRFWRDVGAH